MTNAELAILSLIREKPRHGYEVEQVIEERGMREWTEVGFSSIYYVLKKLESAGMVTGRLQQPAGRGLARKVYEVTDAGRAAWHKATLEALSRPQRPNMPFQLGLANLPGLSLEESLTAVRQYQERLSEQRDEVCGRFEAERATMPRHVKAMFALSLALMEAELAWIGQFIDDFREGEDPVSVCE
jgi:DNA-binding PadR family transcriptional regulator